MALRNTIATLALALSVTIPSAHAGCYKNSFVYFFNEDGNNFKFGHLHNNPIGYYQSDTKDVNQELSDFIANICRMVDQAAVKPGSKWSRCEDRAYEEQSQSCLLIDCPSDCDSGDEECIKRCGSTCPYQEVDQNNLIYQLAHDGNGSDTRTMTYDVSRAGLHSIYDNCNDYGGDTVRDGFWFRLDPNPRNCGSVGDSAIIKLLGSAKVPKKAKGAV